MRAKSFLSLVALCVCVLPFVRARAQDDPVAEPGDEVVAVVAAPVEESGDEAVDTAAQDAEASVVHTLPDAEAQPGLEALFRLFDEQKLYYDRDAVMGHAWQAVVYAIDPGAETQEQVLPSSVLTNPMVRAEFLPEDIGYITLGWIGKGVGELAARQMAQWAEKRDFTGAVLDLRQAGGFGHEDVSRLAGLIVPPGQILFSVLDTHGATVSVHRAMGPPLSKSFPMIALIDAQTRHSAALLAAVLRSQCNVLLVGAPTSGDSALREPFVLPDKRIFWIATRHMLPAGGSYAGKGVVPDVSIRRDTPAAWVPESNDTREAALSEKARLDLKLMRRIADDPALRRAVDILLGLRALGLEKREQTSDGV